MVDGVSVDLHALTTFAHTMGDASSTSAAPRAAGKPMPHDPTVTPALPGTKALTGQMMTGGLLVGVVPAMFKEAHEFGQYHAVVAQSAQQFLVDVGKGFKTLGDGAETCAIGYADTDQFNRGLLNHVNTDLKLGGMGADDVVLTGDGKVTSKDVSDAFNPKDDEATFPTGDQGKGDKDVKEPEYKPLDPTQADKEFADKAKDAGEQMDKGNTSGDSRYDGTQPITIGTDPGLQVPADGHQLPGPPKN